MSAGSIRARVRAEMIEEIKTTARGYLATDGANLSLRAVARDMGMVSSALYRYFASRDDLLTALIIDGYNALGDIAEAADAKVTDRADLAGRWLEICRAGRTRPSTLCCSVARCRATRPRWTRSWQQHGLRRP
jgi:AcrR family transcriptional regulator